jgi:epoxyqueuosine reductase
VLIAAGNSGDAGLAANRDAACRPSPLVRAMAVWALSRLLLNCTFTRLRNQHHGDEADEDVRREWETA